MIADASLPVVWAALIGFAVLAYVVLDGFDLGVGILFAAERERDDRDVMVASIAPVWDGNETWLVLGGGGLLAVFPIAYGLIMPALYPTIIMLLLALVLRGVAFEFRFNAATRLERTAWDIAFFLGSTLAALAQGLTLGGLMQGIRHQDGVYAGGWWDWLSPFTLLCGVAVVVGYAALGASWLVWRTEGALQVRARRYALRLGAAVLALTLLVSLWSPLLHPHFMHRWFGWPNTLLTSPVPLLLGALAYGFYTGLRQSRRVTPFLCAVGWFVLCLAGLAISFWPMMVPPDISIWQAAAPPESQRFLLRGTMFLVPLILLYNAYTYWIFRSRVSTGAYHE